jgi:NADPH:quinone reductase-like Zn-dependent oxidoreductase
MVCELDGPVREACCFARATSMNRKTRVIRFHRTGAPEVLQIDEIELLPLKNNEVLLKMDALAISRADILWREGDYVEDPVLPAQIGYEGAGVLDSIDRKLKQLNRRSCVYLSGSFLSRVCRPWGENSLSGKFAFGLSAQS